MDGADADLVKSSEEILGNVDGLLEVLHPDVDVCTHVGGGSLRSLNNFLFCWDECCLFLFM